MDKVVVPLKRLIPGLIIGPATWLGSYIVAASLFLPALIQQIDAENKVQLLAFFSACGMIVAALSNMLAGYLSDKTRSRFGKRAPWIMLGAAGFMVTMIIASTANSVPVLLISWMLGQVALNFIVAPMVAWIDFAPTNGKATASGAYGGLGMALGNNGFTIIGAMLLGQFRMGLTIFGIVTFLGCLIAVLIVKEPSNINDNIKLNKDYSPDRLSAKERLTLFPKWEVGRDYYLALIGKLAQGVGNFTITGYLLFIMTDFMNKDLTETQYSIQLINVIMLSFGVLMGFVAGPLSDKFKVIKYPVGLSTIALGFGALGLYFFDNHIGVIIYGFAAGIGMGIWNSLDNLLNLRVIPDQSRIAFFLGVYNLGNTITQALAPVISAIVISAFGFSAIFPVSFIFSMIGGVSILLIKSVKK